MKIAAYGAGRDFENFLLLIQTYPEMFNDELVCVIDSDKNKWGEHRGDNYIYSPAYLKEKDIDAVIITSLKYYGEIVERLRKEFHDINFYSVARYKEQKTIEYQYWHNKKRNEDAGVVEFRPFNPRSTVIYTSIFDDYDDLHEPEVIEKDVKYVCFTDQKDLKSKAWNIVYVENSDQDRRLLTRMYKLLPHKLFPEYDTSVWIDANIRIKGSIRELIEKSQQCSNILLFPYMDYICIYDAALLLSKRESKDILLRQVLNYYNEGYPIDNGFMCGGFIVRNHNETEVVRVMEKWYEQVKKYSKRDQISLPYSLWKCNVGYDLINGDIYHNDYIEVGQHKPMAYVNADKG